MTRSYPRKSGENYRREKRRKREGRPLRWYGMQTLACVKRGDEMRPFRGVSKYRRIGTRAVEEAVGNAVAPIVEATLYYSTSDEPHPVSYGVEGVAHA